MIAYCQLHWAFPSINLIQQRKAISSLKLCFLWPHMALYYLGCPFTALTTLLTVSFTGCSSFSPPINAGVPEDFLYWSLARSHLSFYLFSLSSSIFMVFAIN